MTTKEEYKSTVMIIDDTPANLEVLGEMLHLHGYKTYAFPKGVMALRAALQHPPDLILLDIMMPEMNGFEVCRHLKEDESLREIPVIFISALDDTENKLKAFTHGGVDYITKPFQGEEVLARVQTHLKLRQVQKELKDHNDHLDQLVAEKIGELTDAQMATLVAISNLAEFRDEDTGAHIERTRIFCKMLAQQLRHNHRFSETISDSFVENIFYAAALHDMGKIGIPDHILLKPGKLTPEEFDIMKTHTTIGAVTLEKVRDMYPKNVFINMGIELAKSHHERWDGTGYPDGSAGEDIPLAARIMALVDVYDALRSKRPYKKPFSHEESLEIIKEGIGKHFDPKVVHALIALEQQFADIFTEMQDHNTEEMVG